MKLSVEVNSASMLQPVNLTVGSPGPSLTLVVNEPPRLSMSVMGVQGVPGEGAAGTLRHVHHQPQASSVWTIDHPLNAFPSVTCLDTSGEQIVGDIRYVSSTRVLVTFGTIISGIAYLN
jgi:hypothetical protein